MDLDAKMKAVSIGAVFLIVSDRKSLLNHILKDFLLGIHVLHLQLSWLRKYYRN